MLQLLTEKSQFHKRKLLKLEKAGLIKQRSVLFSKSGVYYLTQAGWDNINNPDAHKIIVVNQKVCFTKILKNGITIFRLV